MKKNYTKTGFSIFFLILVINCVYFTAGATLYPFTATYSGANEVPPNASPATGTIVGVYNDVTNRIFYTINFTGLTANVTAAHFHAPGPAGVAAPVIIPHAGFPTGVTSGTYSKSDVLTDAQEAQLFGGLIYSNIHTTVLPGGELRAQIVLGSASTNIFSFSRAYSGANEVPPNASPATGTIVGAYNCATNTIFYTITFSGLMANVVAAHFHSPASPGVNAPVVIPHAGFPTGVTSGTYSKSDVLTDALENHLLSGLMYSNIHTTMFPGGELRTQIIFDAPVISNLGVSPDMLWPPNHKMKDVTVSYSSNTCPGTNYQITVSSDEPVNGLGDGDQAPDWMVIDDHHVKLRAERSGTGDGRVYTITVTCTNQQGTSATATTTVTVPHDMSSSANLGMIVMNEENPAGATFVRVLPNPSRNYFTINIQTANDADRISVRLFDAAGRVVEVRNNIAGSQVFSMGNNLKAGIYFAEIRQGAESRSMKLVKL